ncbi:MAG TPA: 3-hydroxyacyl-CoA dehydrogenase NAD-binding domain-containing protein [Polyangiaceae bacterium]|nr:3-hydroxyacyl-CoA dehydrogenase NAD-binding domain-containing protein [Polyangiaceae bacterium]
MSIIDYSVEDGVAILTWNERDRATNVVNAAALAELDAAVAKAVADASVRGVVLTSGKQGTFVTGGDLEQIQGFAAKTFDPADFLQKTVKVLDQLRRMETCGKPIVAALNGIALGGGYEIALACHRRILVDQRFAKVGLPEAGLGLMPGMGGTQRLPRLIGIQAALGAMLEGRQVEPEQAKKQGLVDEVVAADQLLPAAKKWILAGGKGVQPWDDKRYSPPGGGIDSSLGLQTLMGASAMTHANTFDNFPHAKAILCAVYEGMKLPMDRAGKIEARYVITLLKGPVARSMLRTLFFSLQEARKGARRPKDVPHRDVKKVGVIGAGLMGQGIAHVSAKAGISVVLVDRELSLAERGKATVQKALEKQLEKGRTTRDRVDKILSLIEPAESYDRLDGCDVVVEAVFEDRQVKAGVTKAADAKLSDRAILASNTSGLPITELARATSRPASFIGLHFFSPVDRMEMVEVIMGQETSQETLATAWDYILKIKKAAIVIRDSPGFYTSRVFGTFISEGMTLLAEGVEPALIENAAKMAGMPMPPLAISDQVGLATMHKIALQAKNERAREPSDGHTTAAQALVERLVVGHGREGANTPSRAGFYEYMSDGKKRIWPGLKEALAGLLAKRATQPAAEELKKRYLFAQCVEAARCIEEGIITSPADADVGVVMAVGFHAYTGGPCTFMDNCGIKEFVEDADRLAKRWGPRFSPPKLLREMAATGRKFYA